MTLGLFITIALVVTVIVVTRKVREHSKRIAKLEQRSPTSNAGPPEDAQ